MAVGTSTAADPHRAGPTGPLRTCIGCRKRATVAELFRVVVAPGPAGSAQALLVVVPDPRRRLPGRGAWLHHDPECVEAAQRRRAFARALRAPGPVDPAPVRAYVTQGGVPNAGACETDRTESPAAEPAGDETDELTMKRQ